MAYTTVASVTGSAWSVSGKVSANIISRAISIGDSIIDGKVGRRYSVPIASPPDLIVNISTILARYYGQTLAGTALSNLMEPDIAAKDMMMGFLDDIQMGKMDIPGGTERTADDHVYSNTMDYTPVYDVDDEEDWRVDEDRLDDIEDAR